MTKSERLKTLRMLSGYTQEELAKKINVPRTALSIWENPKKYGPSEESVPALAEALNVSSGYLTYGDVQRNSSVWIPQLPTRKHHQQLFISELIRLLPHFLFENKFASYLTANLADGGKLFLFSRQDNKLGLLLFDTLLLASSGIKDTISSSTKFAEIKAFSGSIEECDLYPSTISNISPIEILSWFRKTTNDSDIYCEIDFDGISSKIFKYYRTSCSKEYNTNNIHKSKIADVFSLFIKHMCPVINKSDSEKISDLFNSICSEIVNTPLDVINEKLDKAFSDELRGFDVLTSQQSAVTLGALPSNLEYQTINEWIKDELADSKNPEEKELFLRKLTLGTNYEFWKVRFEQEVMTGKRKRLWDF